MTRMVNFTLPFWGLVLIIFSILLVGSLIFWADDSYYQKKSEKRTRDRKAIADIREQLSMNETWINALNSEVKALQEKTREIIDAIGEDCNGELLVTATHTMLENTIERVEKLEERVGSQDSTVFPELRKQGIKLNGLEAELTELDRIFFTELREQGIKLNKLKRRLKKEEKS